MSVRRSHVLPEESSVQLPTRDCCAAIGNVGCGVGGIAVNKEKLSIPVVRTVALSTAFKEKNTIVTTK